MKLFAGCSEIDFVHELLSVSYEETQEGFDHLAFEINARCNLLVKLKFYPEDNMIWIRIESDDTRTFHRFIKNINFSTSLFRIIDLLIAFGSGLGYEC